MDVLLIGIGPIAKRHIKNLLKIFLCMIQNSILIVILTILLKYYTGMRLRNSLEQLMERKSSMDLNKMPVYSV